MSHHPGAFLWGRFVGLVFWLCCAVGFVVLCFRYPFEPPHPANGMLELVRLADIGLILGGMICGYFAIPPRLPDEQRVWSDRTERLFQVGRKVFAFCAIGVGWLIFESFGEPELLQQGGWRRSLLCALSMLLVPCMVGFFVACVRFEPYTFVVNGPVLVNGEFYDVGDRHYIKTECFRATTYERLPASWQQDIVKELHNARGQTVACPLILTFTPNWSALWQFERFTLQGVKESALLDVGEPFDAWLAGKTTETLVQAEPLFTHRCVLDDLGPHGLPVYVALSLYLCERTRQQILYTHNGHGA